MLVIFLTHMNILDKIKPSIKEEEKIRNEINLFLKDLNKSIKNARISIGGSFAKGTWLKDNHDIDIFIKFNYNKYKNKDISKILGKSLKGFKFTIQHGSRIYYQIKRNNLTYELVPVLETKKIDKILNVMDISPLHTNYVMRNTTQKLRDEIRIAKAFFKANNLYGAETHKKSFSGYAIEVLVIHYNGFNNLLKATSKWQTLEIIDPKRYYANKDEIVRLLNKSKLTSPLILIDPVQRDRNITAVLSIKNFSEFKKLAKQYLKTKSEKFFIKNEIIINNLKNHLIIEIIPKNMSINVLSGKISKFLEFIKNHLDNEGFIVANYGWKWDTKVYFWYKLKKESLPKLKKHFGPKLDDKINLQKFKDKWKHKRISIESKRVFVHAPRRFTNAIDYLKYLLKEDSFHKTFKKVFIYKI